MTLDRPGMYAAGGVTWMRYVPAEGQAGSPKFRSNL
jgi:hypothetical protein